MVTRPLEGPRPIMHDAGDDHGRAGENARAGGQAGHAAEHAEAAARRARQRAQEHVSEDAAGVIGEMRAPGALLCASGRL